MAVAESRIQRERPSEPPGEGGGAEHEKPIRVPRLLVAASEISWRLLVCIAAGAVVLFGLLQIGFAMIPVAVALLLSTLFVPPARWLQRHGFPPAAATVTVMLCGLAIFGGMIAFIAESVAHEAGPLGDQISGGADDLGRRIAQLPIGLSEHEVQRQIDSIDDRIRENSGAIRSGVLSGAQAAGQALGALVLTLVILFFFVKDGPQLWDWICRRFPETRRAALDELAERVWAALSAYVRGVCFVAVVDAVGIGLGLFLIGVPLVLPLAVLTFVLAFIPIVGAVTAGAAAVLVALVAVGPLAALASLGVVLLVQQLEGNVLYPAIMNRTMELHPVVVLLSVTIGGLLYGIAGAALALPVAVVVASAAATVERHSVHGEVAVGPPPIQEG